MQNKLGGETLQTRLKGFVPFALALTLYIIFALIYFAPQLSGNVVVQSDVTQYTGMAQEIVETREATGVDPQWSGSLFSGMPAYLITVEYPSDIIAAIRGQITGIMDTPAAFILFAMLAMWGMLVMMGVNGYVAIVGGAMYGLSTYFFLIIEAGHLTKMWALAYAPLMMGAIWMTLRGRMLWGAALTALFVSIEISAQHPQITYYFLMAAAALWLSELWFAARSGRLGDLARRTTLLVVAGALGAMTHLSALWYVADHTPLTLRGGSELAHHEGGLTSDKGLDLDYATNWSYGKVESFNLLIPSFVGGGSTTGFSADGKVAEALRPYRLSHVAEQLPAYWGGQPFTSGPTYLGAVVLFLACMGFGMSKGRERWWILAITILMLLLSWGRNMMWFTELMFNILPGYNKFRTVSMTLVVVEWTAPLLATFALAKLWSGDYAQGKGINRVIAWSAGATAGVAIIMAAAGGALFDMSNTQDIAMLVRGGFPQNIAQAVASAMEAERASILAADAIRTVLYVVAAAAVVWVYTREIISRRIMLAVCGVLAVADLGGVAWRHLSHENFTTPSSSKITATAADREILRDGGEVGYRVMNIAANTFNDATTSYFHRSVGGYHGAKLARYQDVIDNYLIQRDSAVLDMLNTRYFIAPTADGASRQAVYRPSALGAAWFVDEVVRSSTPQQEIDMLGSIDLSRKAVVDKRFDISTSTNSVDGQIRLVEYLPHHLTYKYKSDKPATAIFSEVYYDKGWRAFIDGVESPYFRANYILRGMELPEGEHTVEWHFRAPRWSLFEGVSLACGIVILLSLIALMVVEWRSKKNIE
ncbi:MAG: hypothetical protein SNH63_05875 [Rikenellaceae bacterium]